LRDLFLQKIGLEEYEKWKIEQWELKLKILGLKEYYEYPPRPLHLTDIFAEQQIIDLLEKYKKENL